LPGPDGTERVEEADVFEEVGVEPEARGCGEDGDDEDDQADNGHGEEESDEAEHGHAEVPHALPQHEGPEGEEDNGNDQDEGTGGVQLLLHLQAFVQPNVVVVVVGLLVLLNLDGPQALDALGFGVVVAVVGVLVDLGDTQR